MKLWLVAVGVSLPERQEESMKQLIPQCQDENQTDNIRHQELLFHFGFFQETGKAFGEDGSRAGEEEEEGLGRADLGASRPRSHRPVALQAGPAGPGPVDWGGSESGLSQGQSACWSADSDVN